MRTYRMDDPDSQCAAIAARVEKELKGLLSAPPQVGWEPADEGPPRDGLARFFPIEYPVSHRLWATMKLIDEQQAELHLYVDGARELPAGLELFATIAWAPSAPLGISLHESEFDGEPDDVEPLNEDRGLLALVRQVLRTEWARGHVTVERPDAHLEVVPEPSIVHASTLPRNAWLGFVQDFGLLPFLRAADRIEELQTG